MKTLTLKRKTSSSDVKTNKKSGARARVASQYQLHKEKRQKTVTSSETSFTEDKTSVNKTENVQDNSLRSLSHKTRPYQENRKPTRGKRVVSHRAPKKIAIKVQSAPADFNYTKDHIFSLFASCPQGLEAPLFDELTELGFQDVKSGRSGCHFKGDWKDVMRANLWSRVATRILLEVSHAPIFSEDDLYELTLSTPWEYWFGPEHELRVDTSAIASPMKSLQFCNLKVKDGVCDRLRKKEGSRPNINTVRPDARVHAFLEQSSATLYIDTSGVSLFKRGWRFDKGIAPLRENLAAGLLSLAQWNPSIPLIDPFCGSGTILIEAAWKSLNMAPGMYRPFAFERLRQFNRQAWIDMKNKVFDEKKDILQAPILGYDFSPQAIRNARANLKRCKLPINSIEFKPQNALALERPKTAPGMIITNPPYGDRMSVNDQSFWSDWASQLKKEFADWQVFMITEDHDLPKHMRLKPKRRHPVYNGNLDCRLFHFEMVADSYRDK